MLNSKQRSQLRGMANGLDVIVHVGKNGVTENITRQTGDALTARELIKCRVLDSALMSADEAAAALADAVGADVVLTIGSRFVLYRESLAIDKDKRIKLVK